MSRPYNPDPHAHPGLHLIALVEGAKGLLALLGASGLEIVGPDALQRWVELLIAKFQFSPDHGPFAWLLRSINPESVHLAAAAIALPEASPPPPTGTTRTSSASTAFNSSRAAVPWPAITRASA